MEYTTFKEELLKRLAEEVYETETLSVNELKKNNEKVQECISIAKKGVNLVPQIHLDVLYEDYCKGESMESLVETVLTLARQEKVICVQEILDGWPNIKEKIKCKLINYDWNQEMLKEVPHVKTLNLALIFQFQLESKDNEAAGVTINNNILNLWGVQEEELIQVGMENLMKEEFEIKDMEEIMLEIMGIEPEERGVPGVQFVMTNEEKFLGATGIFRTDLFEKFADQIDDNFYIIPCSIHELILVPEHSGLPAETIQEMVKKVNEESVELEYRLSDDLYYFDSDKKEVVRV